MPAALPPWEQDLLGLVSHTESQLARTLGLKPLQVRRLSAALELARRLVSVPGSGRPSCRSGDEVAAIMHPLVLIDHERFWCLALDGYRRLIGVPIEVARGDVDGTDASARAVGRAALRARASQMIVVHNHPSGDPCPSPSDVAVTRHLAAAGRIIEIPLVDHVIVTANGQWHSLRKSQPELWASGPSAREFP
jgi:DNA repair protein RadC